MGDIGNYVEPFAGSLATLLLRPHAPRIETVNDRDCYLANFWRAVTAAPMDVAVYADWPVNECDLQARHRWLTDQPDFRAKMLADPDFYDAKIAGWWVWGISQWIGAGWCSRPEWVGRGGGGRSPRGLNASVHLSSSMGINATSSYAHNDGQIKRPVLNRGARGVCNLEQKRRRRVPEDPDWQHRPHLSDAGNGVHCKLPKMDRGSGLPAVSNQEALIAWMFALADRLRRTRVCCGDWARIVTPSCTWKLGGGQLTGVLLDPPYSHAMRDNRLYSIEDDVAQEVRTWAVANGDNPDLRIALCGLEDEHAMPSTWAEERWRAPRGYSNKQPRREVIWFSPYCLRPQGHLFAAAATSIDK